MESNHVRNSSVTMVLRPDPDTPRKLWLSPEGLPISS